MGTIYVKASRRAKAYIRQSGYAVTSFNRKFGRAIEAKGLTKREAQILKGRLRRGESKGTIHKSIFTVKKYFTKA